MSTNIIKFHDKIRNFPLIFVFRSYWKNFVGTQQRVRISHGKRAIGVQAIEFRLYVPFNNLAVILLLYLDVAGSSMVTFRVLPH